MRLLERVASQLYWWTGDNIVTVRAPDFIIGADSPGGAYLLRWYLTPWRRWRDRYKGSRVLWQRAAVWVSFRLPNLYLHCFLRDDDDRALHDHPSWAVSAILRRGYIEHTIAVGGVHHRTEYAPGSVRFLPTRHTHRIELHKRMVAVPGEPGFFVEKSDACWTLFLFGPTLREWGFHCPERGWVPWQEFTATDNPGEVGKGCDA